MIYLLLLVLIVCVLIILLPLPRAWKFSPAPSPDLVHAVPNQIPGQQIATHLKARMVGTPTDGSDFSGPTPSTVLWVNSSDEVMVHLDSLTTEISGQNVVVSLDLESDQTGRTPIIVVFALSSDGQGGLIAATDEYPRGDGALVSRWGAVVQAAAWNALLSLAGDHASERGLSARALTVADGQLNMSAGEAFRIGPA